MHKMIHRARSLGHVENKKSLDIQAQFIGVEMHIILNVPVKTSLLLFPKYSNTEFE